MAAAEARVAAENSDLATRLLACFLSPVTDSRPFDHNFEMVFTYSHAIASALRSKDGLRLQRNAKCFWLMIRVFLVLRIRA